MGYEYLRNESIIRSKTREFFGVGTVVTASAYLVSVVDFMLIGALLGADAVAAAGLCDSFVEVAELFGFVLSSGGPVAAGILLGKRRLRQANGVFTLSLLLTLAGGLLCWCLLPFCGFFSGVLSNNGAIANDVARYAFFTLLSSPFVGVNLVLSSFAILDDRSKLAMGSVVAANGVNIVLDVVFMKYLRMGVAGAAAASLLGNAAGILVVLPYLLSKKRTFRFVLRADDLRETGRELASSCSSFATDKASRIFSGLTVNLLLMYFVGNIGVALYAVYSQLRFILRILAGGALQTISTLGSMLYGERDFYGLRKMLSLLSKYTYALVAALMAGLFCFSAPFLNSYGIAAEPDTVLSLRIMLLSLPFLWLNDLLARLYPSVQRQRLSVLLLTLQNVVLKYCFCCSAWRPFRGSIGAASPPWPSGACWWSCCPPRSRCSGKSGPVGTSPSSGWRIRRTGAATAFPSRENRKTSRTSTGRLTCSANRTASPATKASCWPSPLRRPPSTLSTTTSM